MRGIGWQPPCTSDPIRFTIYRNLHDPPVVNILPIGSRRLGNRHVVIGWWDQFGEREGDHERRAASRRTVRFDHREMGWKPPGSLESGGGRCRLRRGGWRVTDRPASPRK